MVMAKIINTVIVIGNGMWECLCILCRALFAYLISTEFSGFFVCQSCVNECDTTMYCKCATIITDKRAIPKIPNRHTKETSIFGHI